MIDVLNELKTRRENARLGGGNDGLTVSMPRENSLRANGLSCYWMRIALKSLICLLLIAAQILGCKKIVQPVTVW